MQKAIIYCRVSSERQVSEGNGNKSQEQRCQLRAKEKGYKTEKIFHDDGISGGLLERPAMQELIKYLDKHQDENYIIIFDDLSRFARDVKVHIQLKAELESRGAKLECLNFNFNDSEESEYAELVLAAGNQYQRKSNRRQVIQKMKARIESGYWPFCYPPGLINKSDTIHGKILVPNEPFATIYKKAIEDYRDGILNTLEQVQESINLQYKEKELDKTISLNGSQRILTNILYAGWIEYKPWKVPLQKGKHNGFISKETYDAVQEKLFSKSKAPLRKDYNKDFPLRGFITCDCCKTPVTASWHKGRSKKYAHYHCKQLDCPMVGKTIRKKDIELEFQALVSNFKPNKDTMGLIRGILLDTWNNRDLIEDDNKKILTQEVDKLDAKKKQFMDRIASSTNIGLINEYEIEIAEILKQKAELEKQLPIKVYTQENFGTASKTVLKYLEDPVRMWQSPNYKDKRLLLEMYFEDKLSYDLKVGLGTAHLACLPKLLATKEVSKNHLVEMPGVEPGSGETLLKMYS